MPEKYRVIGLMSGTSLDGLDIALVEFDVNHNSWRYEILQATSIDYNASRRDQLARAINLPKDELDKLHLDFGNWLGDQVDQFVRENNIKADLVASHGHTIFHQPEKGITLQIGDGQSIADRTGLTTVCDFRSLDVKLGGQGAPLVPIGDRLLFGEYLACLNLGGIANISFEKGGKRIAFDIGMANMPLNHFARELGQPYDFDGVIAKAGKVNSGLLEKLNKLTYYATSPPKSLGIEWFLSEMLPLINSCNLSTEDKMATLASHEAFQIARTILRIDSPGKILITGGGAHNKHFIDLLTEQLQPGHSLELPSKQLIDYKESLIFALMGVLRLRNEINCLKSVTGAMKDSSSGQIFYPQTT